MMKLRGSYVVRTTRKANLLPARQHSMKAARAPELRFAMQPVPRQHRHQAPRSPVELELGELAEELEQIPSYRSAFPRKRARLHAPTSRTIKSNDEHSHLLKQQQCNLPESTWCMIQDMITNAKSLGDITRITLTFFKEHETIQTLANSEFGPAFPIVIPASEVYNMLVPRKRRIYDVLHVLEGVGVIKRVRGDEVTGAKGGSFLYFGKEAAIQHLSRIQQLANEAVERLGQHRFEAPSAEEIDIALLKMCEDQAEVERWPGLTTTTTSFLSLLLQQGIAEALALPAISNRLVEAKKNRDPNFTNESAHADVNRRVYDVVSVLASCNLVLISMAPDADDREDSRDKISSRKHVRFNHAIFDDSSSLKIADVSTRKLSSHLQTEKLRAATRYKRSKKLATQKKQAASKSSKPSAKNRLRFGEADLQDDTPLETAELNDPVDAPSAPVESSMSLRIDLSAISAYSNGDYFGHRVKSLPRQPLQPAREDLRIESFCPIIKTEPQGTHDWWDGSLQELLFRDALSSQDLLRWEQMMPHTKKEEEIVWGQPSHVHQPHPHPLPSPHLWADDLDLKCYEEFADDDDAFADSFFAL